MGTSLRVALLLCLLLSFSAGHLELEHNEGLQGMFPDTLGNLAMITRLLCYGNQMTGSVPAGLCNLTKVELTRLEVDCDIVCDCCGDFCF